MLRIKQTCFAALLFALSVGLSSPAWAAPLNCSTAYQIQQSFSNGAAWDMCWERRSREGIVLHDVHYTNPAGERVQVLASAAVAQIHVPYDDNGARYHDVSDYGLGTDSYMNNLQASDCPEGVRLQDGTRNVICQTLLQNQGAMVDGAATTPGEALVLFSVSHVGAYNYIPEWRFLDDGVIEPSMGATGRLQRYTANGDHGWPVRTGTNSYGVSHIHNYYWRLDFDLGDDGTDEVVEEIEFDTDSVLGDTWALSSTELSTEAARSMNPQTQRFWRIRDGSLVGGNGSAAAYDIVALDTGHRDVGPPSEPWTFNDFYVTRTKDCERFISHNPADTAGGCGGNEDVTDFVNGESLVNQDLLVWFGLTFHHIPRDEDEAYMHSHWNQFRLVPRDWVTGTGTSNTAPTLTAVADQAGTLGDVVSLVLSATDADGDVLSFSATNLPAGLSLDSGTGAISGALSAADTYSTVFRVADGQGGSDSQTISWDVANPPSGCTDCVVFTPSTNVSYSNQDATGDVTVVDSGNGLFLQGNTWRRTTGTYDVTANTVVEFEFSSTSEGEIHGLGFDADDSLSSNRIFKVHGTQNWGITNFDNYTSGVVQYRIPVGQYFTGQNMYLVLVNDKDSGTLNNNSTFSNIRVFEEVVVNQPPSLTAPADQSNEVGTAVTLALIASDPEGGTLTYGATNLPAGLSINAASGQITGTLASVQTVQVGISVTDDQGASVAGGFEWVVTPVPNRPPVLTNPGSQAG